MTPRIHYLAALLVSMITVVSASQLRAEADKKVLTMDDYGLWRSVSSTQLSPGGNWMTFDYCKPEADKAANGLYVMNLQSGLRIPLNQDAATYSQSTTNLTKDAPVSFVDQEYDFADEKASYGLSGWTKDGNGIILNHRYDLWLQPLSGKQAINLTGGVDSEAEIRLRAIKLDEEDKFIDLSQPVMLSAHGQWTKKAGFYKLDVGDNQSAAASEPKPLIIKDKSFGQLIKAKKADQFMVTIESFTDCPDYYVTDGTFASPRRITGANPQQVEYHWGHRVLFDYTNQDGVRLQGALAIPDKRKPEERLPMLVSFYEKTSQWMHVYDRPRYASGSASHLMEMVSKGYMLLSPDVHFNTGATGDDMLECVEAAVDQAVELGYADPEHVGLCGHSFSGYGAAYT